jgi:protein TonB
MSARTAERRPLGALGRMSVVAAMHVAVFFVIARSMGLVHAQTDDPPVIDTWLDKPVVPDVPPPPPDPDLTPPRFADTFNPPNIDIQLDPPPNVIAQDPPPSSDHTGTETGTAVPHPEFVNARVDSRHPLSQPPYNPVDIREGNEGSADVEVYVLPTGRVGDVRIVKSSGFPRLDQATVDEAKRKWRLTPATRDGEAVPQWYRLRVVFKLNRQ